MNFASKYTYIRHKSRPTAADVFAPAAPEMPVDPLVPHAAVVVEAGLVPMPPAAAADAAAHPRSLSRESYDSASDSDDSELEDELEQTSIGAVLKKKMAKASKPRHERERAALSGLLGDSDDESGPAAEAKANGAAVGGARGEFFSFLSRRFRGAEPLQQAQQAPPLNATTANANEQPAPASRRARIHHNKHKMKADTNVVVVKFSSLAADAADLFAGDPTYCTGCQCVLSSTSTLVKKPKPSPAAPSPATSPAATEPVPLDEDAKEKPAPSEAVSAPAAVAAAVESVEVPGLKITVNDAPVNPAEEQQLVWVCEFCGVENAVELMAEEVPKTESRDYVLDPGAPVEEKAVVGGDGMVVFVIDISGSMCTTQEVPGVMKLKGAKAVAGFDLPAEAGFYQPPVARSNTTWVSRLQCVQAAVDQQIDNWRKEQPNKKVAIVTFNREVTIYGDGSRDPEVVTGDKLSNQVQLQEIGGQWTVEKPVSESGKTLSDRLFGLEESGATALGPAMLVAVSMASKVNGSRVVLCTDGLANVGLGALDKASCPTPEARHAAEQWYESVGNLAKLSGVSVSVISIKGEACALEDLGKVCELTGGDVTRVDPLELQKNFASMLAKPVIATQVTATFLLHKGLTFRNEELNSNKLIKELGNVTEDTEISFEYEVTSEDALDPSLTALPFQVQIHFTKTNGMKCLRVLSQSQPITHKRSEAEKEVQMDLLGANVMQQSAKLAEKGDVHAARVHNLKYSRLMARNVDRSEESRDVFNAVFADVSRYDESLQQQHQNMNLMSAGLADDGDAAGSSAAAAPSSSSFSFFGSKAAKAKASRSDAHFEEQHRNKSKSSNFYKKK